MIVIDVFFLEKMKWKLKDLCKMRWFERYFIFEIIFDLYEYIVIIFNEICVFINDDVWFYLNNEDWSWDVKIKMMVNGL